MLRKAALEPVGEAGWNVLLYLQALDRRPHLEARYLAFITRPF